MAQLFFPLLALSTSFFISSVAHADNFNLTSSAFTDRHIIPVPYTCDGRNVSPPLSWQGAPEKTRAYALIGEDPDAPGGIFYHWVIYNIPANVSGLPEGASPPGGAQFGKNSFGKTGYGGPCPPASSIHRYIFTLYALDAPLSLGSGASAGTVERAMEGHILDKATILGIFGH